MLTPNKYIYGKMNVKYQQFKIRLNEFLTTKELAELLRIKERKVYDLAASGNVPCSRATGKLLFPRDAINAWLANHDSSMDSSKSKPLVIIGSHDPLLEWALRESRCGLASYLDSSLDGLDRFEQCDGIAAGLHVYDVGSKDWNVPLINPRFANSGAVLVEWAKRDRGMIVNPEKVKDYQSLADFSNKIIVPRQPEAGSQVLLEALMAEQSIENASIQWAPVARSEMDAVVEVLEGKADACFGLSTLATQFRLGFIPVIEERYDLLVDRRAWFDPTWQKFVEFCQSENFAKRAKVLTGYEVSKQFLVHFNSQ